MKRKDEDWDEELYAEEAWEDGPPPERGRLVQVLGTSYGVSGLIHAAALLILATIIIAVPPIEDPASIVIRPAPPRREPPPEAERALEEAPEIPLEEAVIDPVVELEEVPEPVEVPAGTPDAASNKDQRDVSYQDAVGTGGPPAGLQGRIDGRNRASGPSGGGPARAAVVDAALRWLVRHQAPDGRWDCDGWQGQCAERCSGPGDDTGGGVYDPGVSGLALLAFLGDGHTHRYGSFKRVVARGLRWLRAQQQADGSLGFHEGGHGGAYNHAIATLALVEAYHLSRDFTLRKQAQAAVDFCVAAQNPGLGWKYEVRGGRNDTSVTGWMVLALKGARVAGLAVPDDAFAGARRWIERGTDAGGATGYETPGGGSSFLPRPGEEDRFAPLPVMTAVGVVCRVFTGERASEQAVRRGAAHLSAALPVWEPAQLNYYYWYYGSYAQFQVGGPAWERWNEAILAALLPHQRRDGCADGSWDGLGEWCLAGGRVYATALNALTLQVVYRYERRAGSTLTGRPR